MSRDNKITNINNITIKVYPNSYDYREHIYKENNNKSGIYCWENTINNKLYVGSAVNLTKRFYCYLSITRLKKELLRYNSLINKALLKYNYSYFNLNILKYCNENDLIKWEQYYIDLLNPEYNILKIAGSNKGHRHSLDTMLKLKAYKPSPETLVKLRLAKELSGHITIVINKNNNFIKKYNSLNSAAKELNVTRQGLKYCINNNILLKKTFLIIKLIKLEF